MYKTLAHSLLCLTLCAGFASTQANAAITITDFQISNNSISLSFTGTMPQAFPLSNQQAILLANLDYSNGYVFSAGNGTYANSSTFSGTQVAGATQTGPQSMGDCIFWIFTTLFTIGETFSGTLTSTWNTDVLHPEFITDLSQLHLYWGTANTPTATSGVFLAAVPEPSTVALISAAAAAALVLAVRRRRNKA